MKKICLFLVLCMGYANTMYSSNLQKVISCKEKLETVGDCHYLVTVLTKDGKLVTAKNDRGSAELPSDCLSIAYEVAQELQLKYPDCVIKIESFFV